MVKKFITSLDLSPLVIKSDCADDNRREITALTTSTQHKTISDVERIGIKRIKLSVPVENDVHPTDCIHLRKISDNTNLNEIIRKSKYRELLAFEGYSKITDEHMNILNSHWRKRPWLYRNYWQELS